MPIIPDKKVQQVEFCESHWPIWSDSFAQLGLSSAQCLQFKALSSAARAAYDAAQVAKQAYRAAVTAQNAAIAEAVGNAADLIRVIKAFAELTDNPNAVYAIAEIPPPAVPVPAQAPGKPDNLAVNLEPTGAVTISWDSKDSSASSGAFFSVSRRLPGQAGFTPLTGSPGSTSQSRRMSFTDAGVPTSAAGTGVQYIIQGRRGLLMGEPSDAITVQFGVDETGAATAEALLKMAA
jgi:hypothetical protein